MNGKGEMMVVKQSMPVIVSGLIGIIALITPILLNWFFKSFDNTSFADNISYFYLLFQAKFI